MGRQGRGAHLARGPDLLDLALRIFSTTCRFPLLAASRSSASFPILLYYLPHMSTVLFLGNRSTWYCVRSIDQQQPSLTPPPPASRQLHYLLPAPARRLGPGFIPPAWDTASPPFIMPLIMPFKMPFYHATLKFTFATLRVLAPVLIPSALDIGLVLFTMPPTMPFLVSFFIMPFYHAPSSSLHPSSIH